jgi:glycosyltransferase involved in cell wall biosynthesis
VLPGTGAIVSPAHDPRALAACIETYREDPERRTREGHAGRQLALGRYDPDTVVGEWVSTLEAVSSAD